MLSDTLELVAADPVFSEILVLASSDSERLRSDKATLISPSQTAAPGIHSALASQLDRAINKAKRI